MREEGSQAGESVEGSGVREEGSHAGLKSVEYEGVGRGVREAVGSEVEASGCRTTSSSEVLDHCVKGFARVRLESGCCLKEILKYILKNQ